METEPQDETWDDESTGEECPVCGCWTSVGHLVYHGEENAATYLRKEGWTVFPPGDQTLATLQTYGRARAAANAYRGSDPQEAQRLADAQQEAARALVGVSLRAAESEE